MECQWTQIPHQKGFHVPLERSSHSLSIIKDTLYLLGGENVARIPIDSSIYSMNISETQQNWHKLTTNEPPLPRIAHGQAVIGNRIYIFGGRQGITMEESPLNDLHYFDVETKEWTEVLKPDETFPSERSFHQMVAVGKSLFVFGGCGKTGRMSDLHEFDTGTSKWIKHSNEYDLDGNVQTIVGRGGASLVASKAGDKLFLIGGFAGKEMDDVYIYDLNKKVWKFLTETKLPTPRSVCISTGITVPGKGNFIAIFGGEVTESSKGHEGAGGFSNDLILINEETLKITTFKEEDCGKTGPESGWPLPRGWSSGCSERSENTIFIFGGLRGDDNNPIRTNDLCIGKIY